MNNSETPKHDGQRLESLPEGVAVKIDSIHVPEATEKDKKTFAWMDNLSQGGDKDGKKSSSQYVIDKNSIEIDPNSAQA